MDKQVSTAASMKYLYEAMKTAKETWLNSTRSNVDAKGQLGLCTDNMTFPYLDLWDELDESHIVQFDEVRFRNSMLEFHVLNANGFCSDGEWLDEQDFPNDEWEKLIQYIMWKD